MRPRGFENFLLCSALGLIAAGCGDAEKDASAGAPPPLKVEQVSDPNVFQVDHPDQFPLVAAAEHFAVSQLRATGVIAPDISRSVPVISIATGRVVEIAARLGDTVKKGQLLLRVQSSDIAGAFSDYQKAIADEQLTRTQLERAQILYDKGAISLNDFQVAQYHAVFTDSPYELLQAEEQHRGHAIIEQLLADLNDGPLAHLPSGKFNANAAWLSVAAIAHNLLRAAGALAGRRHARARAATVRRDLVAVAARTARHGRTGLTLHLPAGWHREREWRNLFEASCGPPAAAA